MALARINGAKSGFISCFRMMSMYPKHYIEPIFDKKKQEELRLSNDITKYTHIPIKSARNNDSTTLFYDELIQKMTNYITRGGNKKLARELLTQGLERIKRIQIERYNLAPEDQKKDIILDAEHLVIQAVENSRPLLQLNAIKRGGVKYQVPVPIDAKRSYFLAMKWLLEAARDKERNIHFPEKLAWEVVDAAHGQGRVIKRKNDLHRQCEANRAYAHYRWS